jgi:hypothetical protein
MNPRPIRDRQAEQLKWVYRISFVISLGLIAWGAEQWIRFEPSLKWPTVPGVIMECKYASCGTHFTEAGIAILTHNHRNGAQVLYRYAVDGKEYISDQIRLSSRDLSGGSGNPHQFVEEHPVGTSVLVYYEPGNPQNSVLIPGADTILDRVLIFAGAASAVLSVFGYYLVVRRVRREQQQSIPYLT